MRPILVALGAILAATMLLPAAGTSAAPSFSCRYEAMESTADVNVTTIGTRVLVDAVWLQKANCPLQPLADGQLVLFHETSVLSRSSAGKLTGTTRIVVNPPRSLPLYFSGAAIGTFNIQSGGYVAINWATLSTTSNGLKMVDPHQYILLGPMGNLIDSSVDGLPTTISQ